jgi:RNA polymerase sigma-70 factor, ECF subfamily
MTDHRVPMNRDDSTSSTLLSRVRSRDQEAWKRFVYVYEPLVLRHCRRAGLHGADAEDIVQSVLTAVQGAIGRFVPRRKGSLRKWLRLITEHTIIDARRRSVPGGKGVGGNGADRALQAAAEQMANDDHPDPDDEDEERLVRRRAIELILAEYETKTRSAFLAVVAEGRPPADVACELGLSVNAVYLIKSRLLRRIRDEFADLEEL